MTNINLSPILLAFLATLFTYLVTLLGASIVYFFKDVKQHILNIMLAISGGVMLAASYFSLLKPAFEMCHNLKLNLIIPSIGFLFGGLLIYLFNQIMDKRIKTIKTQKKRIIMLITSITLHNIPEGLAVGVAFGSIMYNIDGATLSNAILLALGIGIQNFPEGCAVSLPLRREGLNRNKAFFYGQLSGFVEPIAGLIGALLVLKIRLILPFLLAFAAGAMIYVIIIELIPESQNNEKKDQITLYTIIGFIIMMLLDTLL